MKVILTITIPKSTIDPFAYVMNGIKEGRYKMIEYQETLRRIEIKLQEVE